VPFVYGEPSSRLVTVGCGVKSSVAVTVSDGA
jgi:hypothetical protein